MASRPLVVLFLLAGSAAAQTVAGLATRQVRVSVAFTNGGCASSTYVTLVRDQHKVAEAAVNKNCEADFSNVPVGSYDLIVYGQRVSVTESGRIEVTSSGAAKFGVKVKSKNDSELKFGAPAEAFVSASDLGIPARARQEFDRANKLLAKQDLPQAVEKLKKAIRMYPAYAEAYNNLGVIYARLGEPRQQREALEKAISINDHFALAYVNLGRMNIAAGDFFSAETALNNAAALDPSEAVTLVLLAYSQLMERRFDEAVATSRKAHAQQDHPAFAHCVAASALEQRREAAGAVAELEQFLEEEQTGSQADTVRKELEILRALAR